jgi:hypothetical protein
MGRAISERAAAKPTARISLHLPIDFGDER